MKLKATHGITVVQGGMPRAEAIKQANACHEEQKMVSPESPLYLSGVAFLAVEQSAIDSLKAGYPRTRDRRIIHQAGTW